MLENRIRTIKFGHQFLTMVILEGIFLVRLQSKKHLIPFYKLMFRVPLICLLVHAILGHEQILFEGMKNIFSNYKRLVNRLDLRDT
jgi:hypothetical protein